MADGAFMNCACPTVAVTKTTHPSGCGVLACPELMDTNV